MDPKLAAALVKAQQNVKTALKTSENSFHKYKYASAEEVLIVGREALNNNELAMLPMAEDFTTVQPIDDKCGGAVALVKCKYVVVHESGATYEFSTDVPVVPERGKSSGWSRPADKATFGARTEALGYALRDLLLIPRQDANDVSGRADKGKAGPGTDEQQRQRQDAQQNHKKSAAQHITEISELDPTNDGDFGSIMKKFGRAKQDIASGAEREAIDLLVAAKFAVRLGACTTLDRLEKGAAVASRLDLTGKALANINEAIEAARVRLGSGQ
jgi:hypothetical protein